MLNRYVIPTRFMQQLSPEELLPHNEKYYQQCKLHIERSPELGKFISKEEVDKLVLLQIREAQLDGKRAEERLGTDHALFVERIIQDIKSLSPVTIFQERYQFPLYALSLYLIGYAFFTFLLSAWFGYSLIDAFLYPIPFSAVGMFLASIFLSVFYVLLFRRKRSAKLLFTLNSPEFRKQEFMNIVGIGMTFLIPYVILRLQITVFHVDMWLVLLVGIIGVFLAHRRFLATNTLPN